jgi:UDPglucose--hexose-1-phosphate uridylyltransferase
MLDVPHRRFNPLIREFVLVSPQRAARPWKGQVETPPTARMPRYDSPSNERASGIVNPPYSGTYVFTNDFPALLDHERVVETEDSILLRGEPVKGTCRVICFSLVMITPCL